MKKKKWGVLILLIIALILAARLVIIADSWVCDNGEWIKKGSPQSEKPTSYCVDGEINNFKECVAAGNPIMESYPRKCNANNQTYTEIIENFCTGEIPEVCMNLYEPVCGYPLEKTFSNSCFACQNSEVVYWVKGECL